jgi:hypothetical protein
VRDDGTSIGWLFRAYRYGPDHPAFANKELTPENLHKLNSQYGLK